MRFKFSDLGQRALSAIPMVVVLALAIAFEQPSMLALSLIIAIIIGLELSGLLKTKAGRTARLVLAAIPLLIITAAGFLVLANYQIDATPLWFYLVVGVVVLDIFIASLIAIRKLDSAVATWPFLAALYFSLTVAHLPAIASLENGYAWLILAFIGPMASDVSAYFTGSVIGRHKLAPKISPGKSWEGVIGSLLVTPAVIIGLNYLFGLALGIWGSLGLGLGIAILATLGDLFESWLKRRFKVKDMGTLFPGHGGLLDRLDSLAPNFVLVFWVGLVISL